MRWLGVGLLGLLLSGFLAGCGSGGIEEGMPADVTAPPADFDPGGGAVPNMQGGGATQSAVP